MLPCCGERPQQPCRTRAQSCHSLIGLMTTPMGDLPPCRLSKAWASPTVHPLQWSSAAGLARRRPRPLLAAKLLLLPASMLAGDLKLLACARGSQTTSSWKPPSKRAWQAAGVPAVPLPVRRAVQRGPAVRRCLRLRQRRWLCLVRWWCATTLTGWLPRWRAAWAACSAWRSRRCGCGWRDGILVRILGTEGGRERIGSHCARLHARADAGAGTAFIPIAQSSYTAAP